MLKTIFLRSGHDNPLCSRMFHALCSTQRTPYQASRLVLLRTFFGRNPDGVLPVLCARQPGVWFSKHRIPPPSPPLPGAASRPWIARSAPEPEGTCSRRSSPPWRSSSSKPWPATRRESTRRASITACSTPLSSCSSSRGPSSCWSWRSAWAASSSATASLSGCCRRRRRRDYSCWGVSRRRPRCFLRGRGQGCRVREKRP